MSESQQLKAADVEPENLESAALEAAASPLSLGAQLASKREQLGWSVPDVASHLKLAPRQIDAMEADNYAALPTMVMTRGFIRSYAKLLGLDANALLATISPAVAAQSASSPVHSQLSTPFAESRFSLMGRNKFAYKWLVVLAVLLLLLAVAIRLDVLPGLQAKLQSLTEKSAATATATAAAASVEDNASLPAAANVEAADTAANAALTAAPASVPASAAAVADPVPAGVAAVSEVAVKAAPANPVAASGGELSLSFRQDSWVEIKRADNTVLISRLVKAGSKEAVDMSQPVNIIIGNLAGVDATLRGAPLDLKAGSKTNVARLNLK